MLEAPSPFPVPTASKMHHSVCVWSGMRVHMDILFVLQITKSAGRENASATDEEIVYP